MFWFWFLFSFLFFLHSIQWKEWKLQTCRVKPVTRDSFPGCKCAIIPIPSIQLLEWKLPSHGRTEIKNFSTAKCSAQQYREFNLLSNHSIPGDCACTQGRKAHQGSGTVRHFPLEGVSDSKQYLHLQAAKISRRYDYQVVDIK